MRLGKELLVAVEKVELVEELYREVRSCLRFDSKVQLVV